MEGRIVRDPLRFDPQRARRKQFDVRLAERAALAGIMDFRAALLVPNHIALPPLGRLTSQRPPVVCVNTAGRTAAASASSATAAPLTRTIARTDRFIGAPLA